MALFGILYNKTIIALKKKEDIFITVSHYCFCPKNKNITFTFCMTMKPLSVPDGNFKPLCTTDTHLYFVHNTSSETSKKEWKV